MKPVGQWRDVIRSVSVAVADLKIGICRNENRLSMIERGGKCM